MANVLTEHRLIDGTNRTLIKLTGVLDNTGQVTANVVVDVSTLAYAANANGLLMVSNTHPRNSYGVTIKKILADVTGGYVTLAWHNSGGNNTIMTLGPGYKEIDFEWIGGVFANPEANTLLTSGDIILNTLAMGANNAYTIILDLKKNGGDYINN